MTGTEANELLRAIKIYNEAITAAIEKNENGYPYLLTFTDIRDNARWLNEQADKFFKTDTTLRIK